MPASAVWFSTTETEYARQYADTSDSNPRQTARSRTVFTAPIDNIPASETPDTQCSRLISCGCSDRWDDDACHRSQRPVRHDCGLCVSAGHHHRESWGQCDLDEHGSSGPHHDE